MKVGDKVYVVVARELKAARVVAVHAEYIVCELSGPITGQTTCFGAMRDEGNTRCRVDDQVADAMRVTWGWRG